MQSKPSFKAFMTVLFSLSVVGIYAQSIKGIVKDQYGSEIIGAHVLNVQTQEHAHTDFNGTFELATGQVGDSIMVTSIGYEPELVMLSSLDDLVQVSITEKQYRFDEVVISQGLDPAKQIAKIDLAQNPVQSSQEVLRVVPGLFIAQHAGGGKAEQIFLRGFDIDHGTDIAISVEGMPVNMVSHAHGQGYSDLHFLMPELIESVDFAKGPYDTKVGNFATAGHIDFRLKDQLAQNTISAEFGSFNTKMLNTAVKLIDGDKTYSYIAGSLRASDGPFESSQNFDRLNLLTRWSHDLDDDESISFIASHFTSKWDASGQIPKRAVESGQITRFGAIDDTEGGNTSRTDLAIQHRKTLKDGLIMNNQLSHSLYDFRLWSNFTFFLRDPENSDQIRQSESRNITVLKSTLDYSTKLFGKASLISGGVGLRHDRIKDNELSYTRNRQELLQPIQFGDVIETNYWSFANAEIRFDKLVVEAGLRADLFDFEYEDRLANTFTRLSSDKVNISPKLNLSYYVNDKMMVYAKSGIGFHSNDSRVALQEDEGFAPSALGVDLGVMVKPNARSLINLTAWTLDSDQEFVYVGDEGVVEPSGESLRRGVDLSLRYQLTKAFGLQTDWTYTHARAKGEPEGMDFIPLAPVWTGTASLSYAQGPWNGSISMRYLGDRAANEDNSIVAEGYTVLDAAISYRWKKLTFQLSFDNVLDTDWDETQFATESRLANELEPVEEIHFTPGTPRFTSFRVSFNF